ncbi:FtsK/SpoIIIE domain-containing protein [Actinopolymorpha pittospori]|uniref:S-DNA-T family DNA segregation ATPase FtsK/SpoIIIE n=1 Tax=Actinopolymorpha pittospori TaxID=648752 RepID=A0A927MX83_9ACTN|nr:FtsK/SpoIIIE domain-containing protein [Actinopolymorpha pittospori]MBE1606418.1 S-DNA-T family DNA segregation ATPase FtsK/SpoIIIE [Actinopolymorpha pittospori]
MSSRQLGGLVLPGLRAGDTPATTIPATSVSGLSAYHKVHFGIDEYGRPLQVELASRSLLAGGLSRSGKSGFISNGVGHMSQCTDARIILIDGKIVELILWKETADFFVGPDPVLANHVLFTLQEEMNRRYEWLTHRRRRKVVKGDGMDLITVWIDELSVFTTVYGTRDTQERFLSLLMDLVQRGPAAGIVVVAATQRPSAEIVPTRVRDVFSYRVAFRCSTQASSDIILGTGWADLGYDASKIPTNRPGVGYCLAEEGRPFRFRSVYLEDDEIDTLVARSLSIRGPQLAGAA